MKFFVAIFLLFLPAIGLCADTPALAAVQYQEAESNRNYVAALENVSPMSLRAFRKKFALVEMGETYKRNTFGKLSQKEIEALTDAAYCAKVFAVYFSLTEIPGLTFGSRKVTPLGTVYDGDSMAYVVLKSRQAADGKEFESVYMLEVVQENGKWFLPIPAKLRSSVAIYTK